jgi:cobalt-precorrin 5A hydrolase
MKRALITLSAEGAVILRRLAQEWPDADLYVHEVAGSVPGADIFTSVMDLTVRLFPACEGLVYVLPCGVAVRAVAPHLQSKKSDPAVVVVDVGGRHAVSLLSGHEGGANRLALEVANVIGAEPVISTTTEALKTLIAGIGCRRGVDADAVKAAVHEALERVSADLEDVRFMASADIKADEAGLLQAAQELGVPLRFIPSDQIRNTCKSFERSEFVQEKVGLPAVAEPVALLAGRRTRLLLPKTIFGAVTVALAREDCTWSE